MKTCDAGHELENNTISLSMCNIFYNKIFYLKYITLW